MQHYATRSARTNAQPTEVKPLAAHMQCFLAKDRKLSLKKQ